MSPPPIPSSSPSSSIRRRLPILLGVAALAVIAAFAAVYFLFFTGDSPDELRLSTPVNTTTGAVAATSATTAPAGTGTTPTTAAAAAAPSGVTGNWAIGNGSVAGYRVREKLARLPATSDAVGRTKAITGSIQVAHEGSRLVVAQGAKFDVDVSKLASDESMRDSRIRTMGLESSRFPTATFLSSAAIQLPASAESGQAVTAEVTGDLTIHGVTKRVTIPVETQLNGGRLEVVGSLAFPFSDFGMSPPNIGGFVTVENNATLEFQLFFDKK